MQKGILITIFFISAFSSQTKAQYYFYNEDYYDNPVLFEVGASVGAMNALTSLGGHKGLGQRFLKDLNTGQTHLSGSVYFGALYKNQFGIRIEGTSGMVSGADSVLKKDAGTQSDPRYDRNLSFRSNISEISAIIEFYPTYIFRKYDVETSPPKAAPYLMIGLGYFHFNPQTLYKGQWVDLQPLSTEGQGFAEYPDRPVYSLSQTNIPLGIGVKYEVNARLNLRAEFLYRKLHTDYLDDVSTRYIDNSLYQKYFGNDPVKLERALALNYRGGEIGKDHDHQPGAPRGNTVRKNTDAYFTLNFKAGFILGRTRIK
ncbi:MAG: hypothetical protein NVSMB45_04020 [Ginsengibacter sp.]